MSKQSEAKKLQGYDPSPIRRVCANCRNYISTLTPMKSAYSGAYIAESNIHCGIGGFAVKKNATCNNFTAKQPK